MVYKADSGVEGKVSGNSYEVFGPVEYANYEVDEPAETRK